MEKEDLIEKISEFLNEFYKDELLTSVSEEKKSIRIDFSLVDKFDVELADNLLENPEEFIEAAEEAVKQTDTGLAEAKLKLRFFNLPESREVRIRNLRAEHLGKLVTIDGIVKRASEVRPEVSETIFSCPQCGNRITIIQTERIIERPNVCDSCGNRLGFKQIEQKMYDARWITLEEPFEITTGERPSEVMIFLKEDLASPRMQNITDPGNRIKIVGILKQMPRIIRRTRSRQMEIYLDANSVENVEVEWEELDINTGDEKRILELANDPEIYNKLIASVAPALYGLDDIKEAIALQLFGGEAHIQKDKSRVRGDIHILLVGDPSTAKSALMKVVSSLIPRGRYVSGKGVTGAGLTATVVRDEEFLGGWVLEAGALVMCNRSLICIDEFEKIEKTDQVALHEAMEQNTISIAKANIIATLPAQTAILGGGNPKYGRFDPYMPIKEQIDVPETLLSRFDLKFALRDIPNPEQDAKVADHILKARHYEEEEIKPVIESDFLKKYISYVRKNCHPKLTKPAGEALKEFFVALRERVASEEAPVPITLRQYEALIRLAEASAKIRLKKEVSEEDAIRAINLMKASLRQFGFEPETGKIDIDRVEGHMTSRQRSKVRTFWDLVEELSKAYDKNIPQDELIKRGLAEGIENIEEMLEKELLGGRMYSPAAGILRKVE